ncbi:MAG: type II toxin-antitoxin system VapC family toxin [Terriglobales bacterium]
MAYLLDTNILSEIRRLKPEPKVLAFISGHSLDELYISAVTLAELRFGIELLSQGNDRRAELNDWLTHAIRPMFDQRVLPVTEDIMFRWRVLLEEGRKTGHTYSQPDLIIAATAIHHGLTVVTRDRSDYEKARVPVVNPWRAS